MMRHFHLTVIGLLAVGIAIAGLSGRALAHAHLRQSTPSADSSVPAAPPEIRLWFTERLESSLSSIKVLDAAGKRVDKADGHTDPDDGKQLIVALGTLEPGVYKVVWRVVSIDTHIAEGVFSFTVGG